MTRHQQTDDVTSRLDPEVAALVRAAKAADDEKKARNRGIEWLPDGKPTEMKLKFSSTAALCIGAGFLSAAGGLVLFNWPEADALHLFFSQVPAAGLIAYAFAKQSKNTGAAR